MEEVLSERRARLKQQHQEEVERLKQQQERELQKLQEEHRELVGTPGSHFLIVHISM